MSKTNVLPKKNTLSKLLWLAVLVAVVVWIVQHPYQARHALDSVVHALTVLFSGLGGGR
ncbi:hypothetical protein [Amycolatopsis methanolica]|uniref:TraE protein n=1 Tax=Amycolatopsis methanolica 239 TaxID=1068978 RepID=A0A076MHH5_AMYME|nr:hypothetical protein [Amycolatopsis methanolica]AIJ20114.1 traE gene [Amycolatopsis methanolica 239]prf//2124370E traE gene [Amycolatopsis methanolica]